VPAKTALAHARAIGEDRQREIVGEMTADPGVSRIANATCRIYGRSAATVDDL
jgi:hypothetical protein